MSKIGLAILLILLAGRNYAQQDYFVLIQADNNQPFYARMEGKLFSSSTQGHLILSQLKEGSYGITIGFPKQNLAELQFSMSVHNKDFEFQLKDLGEKGWGLFNPQTLELKMPDEKKEAEPKNHLEGVKKDDAFSRLMAGVVSDTAVMYNTYTMEATLKDSPIVSKSASADTSTTVVMGGGTPPAPSSPTAASGKDTTLASLNSLTGTEAPKENIPTVISPGTDTTLRTEMTAKPEMTPPVTKAETITKNNILPADSSFSITKRGDSVIIDLASHKGDSSVAGLTPVAPESVSLVPKSTSSVAPALPKASPVVKISERKTTKGVRLVYADHIKGSKADTIVIIIPGDTAVGLAQRSTGTGSIASSPVGSGNPAVVPAGADRLLTVQKEADIPAQKTSPAAVTTSRPDTVQKKMPTRSLFINSDCRNFATEYDVDKLRVKMLEAGKEEDRITTAHKVFKTKCFSTRQVKALSEVFTSDALKFRFLETAYPFVSDDHFKELAELLADPVYNSKFRTMTGQ